MIGFLCNDLNNPTEGRSVFLSEEDLTTLTQATIGTRIPLWLDPTDSKLSVGEDYQYFVYDENVLKITLLENCALDNSVYLAGLVLAR